jgi:hypothetical protein
MWANYSVVELDIGELGEACRALRCVVEGTTAKGAGAEGTGAGTGERKGVLLDVDVLERLVAAVTKSPVRGEGDEEEPAEQRHEQLPGHVQDLSSELSSHSSHPPCRSSRHIHGSSCGKPSIPVRSRRIWTRIGARTQGGLVAGDGLDVAEWHVVVGELADVLRGYGLRVEGLGAGKWRMQARSVVRS